MCAYTHCVHKITCLPLPVIQVVCMGGLSLRVLASSCCCCNKNSVNARTCKPTSISKSYRRVIPFDILLHVTKPKAKHSTRIILNQHRLRYRLACTDRNSRATCHTDCNEWIILLGRDVGTVSILRPHCQSQPIEDAFDSLDDCNVFKLYHQANLFGNQFAFCVFI